MWPDDDIKDALTLLARPPVENCQFNQLIRGEYSRARISVGDNEILISSTFPTRHGEKFFTAAGSSLNFGREFSCFLE